MATRKRIGGTRSGPSTAETARLDDGSFEEIAGQLRGLLIRLEDRLPADAVQFVAEEIDASEFGVALEVMSESLAERAESLEPAERHDLLSLAARMDIERQISAELALCPPR